MKAISIKQPWAWAVIYGGKDIENRDWTTKYRGPLLIHAGKSMTRALFDHVCSYLKEDGITPPDRSDLELGGIIGQVELVKMVEDHPSRWFEKGRVGWVLKNPTPLPFVPLKGQLGLFNVDLSDFA